MRLILAAIAITLVAQGQTVVDKSRIPARFRDLEPSSADRPLRCEVSPVKPRIDFGFRFYAGYLIRVPMNQYSGAGHGWAILARVTPVGGGEPVFLLSVIRLPNVPKTKLISEVSGSFLLGEGAYKVDLLLLDDSTRICRKSFSLEAKRTHGERDMTLRIEPGSVRSIASRHAPTQSLTGERPYRISVLVNVAPMFPRSLRLRSWDRELLLGTLGPLLELLPAQSVRLVMFSLDQQKTLLARDGFRLEDINEVAESLNGLELATVHYSVLKKPTGHLLLLADTINQELDAKEPPDAVVFLGPISRFIGKLPPVVLASRGGGDDPHMFYVQYRPPIDRGAFSDVIENVVKSMKGKTFHVHSPSEFAAAIRQMSRL